MSQKETLGMGKLALIVAIASVITLLRPSSEGLESEALKTIQRKARTRKDSPLFSTIDSKGV